MVGFYCLYHGCVEPSYVLLLVLGLGVVLMLLVGFDCFNCCGFVIWI